MSQLESKTIRMQVGDLAPVEGVPLYRLSEAPAIALGADTESSGYATLVRAATAWHEAKRHPGVIALDAFISYVGVRAVTGSREAGLLYAATFLVGGLLLGLWKQRSALEAQGVSWLWRPLLPLVVGSGLAAGIRVSGQEALEGAIGAGLLFMLIRGVLWVSIALARRHGTGLEGALVVGTERRVDHISHRIQTFPEAGLRFESAFIPDGHGLANSESDRALLEKLLHSPSVKHVLCFVDSVTDSVLGDFLRFSDAQAELSLVLPPTRLCALETRAHLGDLSIIPIYRRPARGSAAAKRAFDLLVGSILLLLASPLLLLVAAAIRLGDPGPAIFKQQRVGKGSRPFTIYKFRSMVVDAEARRQEYMEHNVSKRGLLFKVDQDPRITPVGRIVRRLSIDELPQLFNVIKGDMSLVGPRPLPVDPDDFEAAAQLRHEVLPGMTGLWQVKGANALSYSDMVELDITYVATQSLGVDLMILLRTIPAVFVRRAPY